MPSREQNMPQTSARGEAERKFCDSLEAFMDALYTMVNCSNVAGAHELAAAIIARFAIATASTRPTPF